ncbi:MAG: hypothetical protein ACP5JB_05185 [candidate division WOR-3 bacterium]
MTRVPGSVGQEVFRFVRAGVQVRVLVVKWAMAAGRTGAVVVVLTGMSDLRVMVRRVFSVVRGLAPGRRRSAWEMIGLVAQILTGSRRLI